MSNSVQDYMTPSLNQPYMTLSTPYFSSNIVWY